MASVVKRVFAKAGPAGQQIGHALLRLGSQNCLGVAPAAVYGYLQATHGWRANPRVGVALKKLREAETDVSELLFCDDLPRLPNWTAYLGVLPAAMFLSLLAAKLSLWAMLPFTLALVAIFWVQIRLYLPMMLWHSQREAISRVLAFGVEWRDIAQAESLPPWVPSAENCERLRQHFRRGVGAAAWISEYLNILVLHQYREFRRQTDFLHANLSTLQTAYLGVGWIDAACDLSEFVQDSSHWCPATVSKVGGPVFHFEGLVNPLVPDSSPLHLVETSKKGLFISGQNASGKSTMLRAIGISWLFGAGWGGCFAEKAALLEGVIATSINAVDSVQEGNSLYVAELKRARELFEIAKLGGSPVIIVDELFRGTNYLESVAASASTIRLLCSHATVIAASHNLVLAPILEDVLAAKRLDRNEHGVTLTPGVLADTNGLRLFDCLLSEPSASAYAAQIHQSLVEGSAVYPIKSSNDPALQSCVDDEAQLVG